MCAACLSLMEDLLVRPEGMPGFDDFEPNLQEAILAMQQAVTALAQNVLEVSQHAPNLNQI